MLLDWFSNQFVRFTDVAGTFKCDLCGMKFSVKATFEQHKKSHGKDTEPMDSVIISSVVNEIHETESNELKKQISDDYTNIANSSRKSSNILDIQCKADGCDKTFATQKQLKTHMNIHKLATYKCPKCKRDYHSKSVYETHVRLCMPACEDVVLVADEDIDSGPVECSVCSQLFENKKVLKFHQKICNDDGDTDNKGEGVLNQEIEEIYLKTEIEDELENLGAEF